MKLRTQKRLLLLVGVALVVAFGVTWFWFVIPEIVEYGRLGASGYVTVVLLGGLVVWMDAMCRYGRRARADWVKCDCGVPLVKDHSLSSETHSVGECPACHRMYSLEKT